MDSRKLRILQSRTVSGMDSRTEQNSSWNGLQKSKDSAEQNCSWNGFQKKCILASPFKVKVNKNYPNKKTAYFCKVVFTYLQTISILLNAY